MLPHPFAFEVWPTQDLTGLPFDAAFTADERPTIRLELDASWMLSYVDWATDDTDGDGVLTEADGDLESLVLFGVHSTGAYAVRQFFPTSMPIKEIGIAQHSLVLQIVRQAL